MLSLVRFKRVLESSFPDNRLPRWFAQIRGMTENAAIEVDHRVSTMTTKGLDGRSFALQGEADT
ncbi:hypothetical protein AO735_03170 [Pseudomonas sp. TTU2014-096BSC]|nr:hypothetical protein AO735_03170 [Pseudomonas sp. TTU2014-096BSC]